MPSSTEELWPVRNVAEYTYCPRLFYYMQIEGITLPSSDTEKGLAVHRRVDKPSVTEADDDPSKPKSIRSMALTCEKYHLTGILDLVEISDNTAVPVEYRKGRPKRIYSSLSDETDDESEQKTAENVEPWPVDRVQVGLQAVLLESNGYKVDEAVIYYASVKSKLKITVDDNLKIEALEILEKAVNCAKNPRPLPLVNDPKCPKCSLQPICLPDEINYQRIESQSDELSPRKIWPPCDDGIHLVAQQDGVKIGIRGKELKVTDKNGDTVKTMPLASVESLSILGTIQISTQAICALTDMKIPIAFLSSAGRLVSMMDPLDSVSAEIRKAQVRKLDCPKMRLELARALISTKILNQRTLLMRNHSSLPDGVADDLAKEAKSVTNADSLDAIRGHEGQAAAIYFKYFSGMFKGPLAEEFNRNGRKRRPPPDPINSSLSLAYTMLTHECVVALRLARLEPTIGGFHVSRPGRPAFALDLMEPFRPLVSDSVVITSFNRGELTEGHFLQTSSGYNLTSYGRRNFFNALGRRMDDVITHPVFDYRLSYRRMIVLHARMIAAWFIGEIPTLSFLTTR